MIKLENSASAQALAEQQSASTNNLVDAVKNSSAAKLLAAGILAIGLNACGDDDGRRAPVTPPPPTDCVNCGNGGSAGTGGSTNVGGSGGSVETGGSAGNGGTAGVGGSPSTGGMGGTGGVDNSTTSDVQIYSFDVPSPEWAADWSNLRSKRDQFENCAPNCNAANNKFYPIGQNDYSENFPNQGGGYVLYIVTKDKNGNPVTNPNCRNFDMNTNGQSWGAYHLAKSADQGDTFNFSGYQPVEFASTDYCPGTFALIATESFGVSAKGMQTMSLQKGGNNGQQPNEAQKVDKEAYLQAVNEATVNAPVSTPTFFKN